MISIARMSLSSFYLNPNSFLCNSNLRPFPSIHLFSTSRGKSVTPSPEICDVFVNKHHFSPDFASLAASRLPKFRCPERADSVISFLKENSFTTAQLEKIIMCTPQILGFTIESLEFRFKVFQDLRLSSEEIAKMITSYQSILNSSMANKIIPSLSVLKGLLGSDHDVARLLTKSAWFLTSDLEKILMPNVEILKSCGIPMQRILRFLYSRPRILLVKPVVMRKSVDKAIEIGVPVTSAIFIHAAGVLSFMSQGMWEVKLQTFRELGFSDDDIFAIFRKQPMVFAAFPKKLKKVVELLLATGKYNISNIVMNPSSLGYSIEKRLEPRLQILRLLESKNLIERWPSLGRVSVYTDEKFLERFVSPYLEKVGEAFKSMSYLEGKLNET